MTPAVTRPRRVPFEPVRRILGFDARGLVSLVLWVTRRRDGVSPGAVPVAYAGEQVPSALILLFVLAVETPAAEVLLRALGAPAALRALVLVADLYSIVFCLAVHAACVTRPHVVSETELRIRYGVFFDARIPRELISSVRTARDDNEPGMVSVRDGRLGVAVGSRTNVVVRLAGPVTVTRPLGRHADVIEVRFFADAPHTVTAALRRPAG
ncbi:hypothetical protein JOL79_07440 [Microbispora sp. RL4-1S]|uniref:Uncharacterized protein n=1 Tax=Microbispora oryzae TaxID=2806554 RepID=A0A941AIA8_9ACTN|nr:hypothetical protein [Microbispora oryzae]MBP2703632.1 hypothetical protein [Microbispora oryzae]